MFGSVQCVVYFHGARLATGANQTPATAQQVGVGLVMKLTYHYPTGNHLAFSSAYESSNILSSIYLLIIILFNIGGR